MSHYLDWDDEFDFGYSSEGIDQFDYEDEWPDDDDEETSEGYDEMAEDDFAETIV